MNLFLLLLLIVVVALFARWSRRPGPDRFARNPKLWFSVAAAMAATSMLISTTYVVGDNADLTGEVECRAELAAPVNDATSQLTSANARGLVVFLAQALEDPQITAAVKANLGGAGLEELREQVNLALMASDDLDAANDQRGLDPVATCK